MSLTVLPELIEQAKKASRPNRRSSTVRDSLPYAWSVVTRLVDELHDTDAKATYNEIAPPDYTTLLGVAPDSPLRWIIPARTSSPQRSE